MTRGKKKVDVNSEEHKKQQHDFALKRLEEKLDFIPEPALKFELGEKVRLGNLEDVMIHKILHGGKILEIDYTSKDNNYGNPIYHYHEKGYRSWVDVKKYNENMNSVIQNDDIRLNYSQTHLSGMLSKVYSFGVDFDPEYQREYVWDTEDKIKLIKSIFNNVDIGKFSFVYISDRDWVNNGYKYAYEILDGKQRLRAICDFYEGRFAYQGYYFSDLSVRDQNHFTSYNVNVAEVRELDDEQKLRYFLMLNTGGRMMSEEHLDKVRKMLILKEMK